MDDRGDEVLDMVVCHISGSFSEGAGFPHYTQHQYHRCRDAGSGKVAINKPFIMRERRMQLTMTTSDEDFLSMSFKSLGLATNHSGSSNEVSYGYSPYNYGIRSNSGCSSYRSYGPFH